MKHGHGTYSWKHGDAYVGDYANDKRHGQGKFTFADGKVQEGLFENDKFNGHDNTVLSQSSFFR